MEWGGGDTNPELCGTKHVLRLLWVDSPIVIALRQDIRLCFFCRKAKLLLKKKRYLEGMLTKTDTQLDNLQEMVERIEYAQVEIQVVEGLKQGNECLEKMHQVSLGWGR